MMYKNTGEMWLHGQSQDGNWIRALRKQQQQLLLLDLYSTLNRVKLLLQALRAAMTAALHPYSVTTHAKFMTLCFTEAELLYKSLFTKLVIPMEVLHCENRDFRPLTCDLDFYPITFI